MEVPAVEYVTTSDGFKIAFSAFGEGPALVALPSPWLSGQAFWSVPAHRATYEWFAAHFRVVKIDLRGLGLSTRGLGSRLALADFERDLEAVVGALGLERYSIFAMQGFSAVAIQHAARYPACVEALATLNPAWFTELAANLRYAQDNWRSFLAVNARMSFDPFGAPMAVADILKECVSQPDYLTIMTVFREEHIEPLARQVRVPTLVIGSRDWLATD